MLSICPSCNEAREDTYCQNCGRVDDKAGPQGAMGPGTCPEGVTGPRHYRMQVDLGDVLRAADPLGPIGNAELSTPDKFLLPSIVERDRLWCQALIATLSVKDIAKVTTMFNKLRPD